MSRKTLGAVEIKSPDEGTVRAVFSTFGVRDLDRDVTLPGAFTDGAPVVISAYGHTSWSGALPVGKGAIRIEGDQAILEGKFFLDTTSGADTFRTVRALAEDGLGEWSYGYDAVKISYGEHEGERVRFLESLRVHEVSPVLQGAGVGTRTLAAKAAGMRFTEEAADVLASVEHLAERAADVMAVRAEKGKGLGRESTQVLADIEAQLKALRDLLRDPTEQPDAPTASGDLGREFLRWQRAMAGL